MAYDASNTEEDVEMMRDGACSGGNAPQVPNIAQSAEVTAGNRSRDRRHRPPRPHPQSAPSSTPSPPRKAATRTKPTSKREKTSVSGRGSSTTSRKRRRSSDATAERPAAPSTPYRDANADRQPESPPVNKKARHAEFEVGGRSAHTATSGSAIVLGAPATQAGAGAGAGAGCGARGSDDAGRLVPRRIGDEVVGSAPAAIHPVGAAAAPAPATTTSSPFASPVAHTTLVVTTPSNRLRAEALADASPASFGSATRAAGMAVTSLARIAALPVAEPAVRKVRNGESGDRSIVFPKPGRRPARHNIGSRETRLISLPSDTVDHPSDEDGGSTSDEDAEGSDIEVTDTEDVASDDDNDTSDYGLKKPRRGLAIGLLVVVVACAGLAGLFAWQHRDVIGPIPDPTRPALLDMVVPRDGFSNVSSDELRYAYGELTHLVDKQVDGIRAGTNSHMPTCIMLAVSATSPMCARIDDFGRAAGWLLYHHVDAALGQQSPLSATAHEWRTLKLDGPPVDSMHAVLGSGKPAVVVVPGLVAMAKSDVEQFHVLCDKTQAPHKAAMFVFPVCLELGDNMDLAPRVARRDLIERLQPALGEQGDANAVVGRLRQDFVAWDGNEEQGLPRLLLLMRASTQRNATSLSGI